MKQPTFIIPGFLFLLFAVTGCTGPKTFQYDNILKEYSDVICKLEAVEKSGGTEACSLNRKISLKDAVRIALLNNPEGNRADARVRSAGAMLERARAPFYPYAGMYTEYVNGDAPSTYLFKKIDQRELPMRIDFNDPGSIENFEAGMKAGINIYNGGRDTLNRMMAASGLEMAKQEREGIRNKIVSSVIKAYYDVLAAGDFIEIARESVDTIKTQLHIMRVRFESGGALKSDILSLEVRLARAQEDVVASENRFRMALTALGNILGVGPDTKLELTREKEGRSTDFNIPMEYVEGLEAGLSNRIEIRKTREWVRSARMAVQSARAGHLPSVSLNAKWYVDDESLGFDFDRDNWMAALLLDWNLFSGFSVRAGEKKAEADLEEALAADRQVVLAVKMDIKNAYFKLEEAKARLEVARKSVDMAQESLDLVKKQYEGGSVGITRYLEAELDRNRARIRSTAAFFDREKAIAGVGRAIGFWGKAALLEKTSGNN